jgi:putative Mg2+ transporter-C (MgtC) family protein
MDIIDVALRLGAAALAGAVVGLNRDVHDKPTGVRTLGLVALGSATIVMAAAATGDAAAVSRVIQGLVTGIGFLGAGVIIRGEQVGQVHGLTTAACVWLTACMGATCAVAAWPIVVVGLPLVFVLLIGGGAIDEALRRHWQRQGGR